MNRAVMLVLALILPGSLVWAQTPDEALVEQLRGRWSGTIVGPFRSQEVSWRFEVDNDGRLRGYMGPSSAGLPTLPMNDLVLGGDTIDFRITPQHGRYQGEIGADTIRGTWWQGPDYPLVMRKQHFYYRVDPAIHAQLIGTWDMDRTFGRTRLEFRDAGNSRVEGFMHFTNEGLADVPLKPVMIAADGTTTFATEDRRSFTGQLVNGVLTGDYLTPGRRPRHVNFIHHARQDADYVLDLDARDAALLLGDWVRQNGPGIYFRFSRNARGEITGMLDIPDNNLREPVLEASVRAGAISIRTYSGRRFSGLIDSDSMAGQYVVDGETFEFTFAKVDNTP